MTQLHEFRSKLQRQMVDENERLPLTDDDNGVDA